MYVGEGIYPNSAMERKKGMKKENIAKNPRSITEHRSRFLDEFGRKFQIRTVAQDPLALGKQIKGSAFYLSSNSLDT
jgi:hypothetical protein